MTHGEPENEHEYCRGMCFVGLFSPYDHGIHQPVKEPSALHQGREEVHDPSRYSGGLANRGGRQERHAARQADGEVIPEGSRC